MDLNGQPRIPLTTRLKRAALAFDAWLNASLYSGGRRMGEAYGCFSDRMAKLRVRGFKRFVLDLTSEGVTLGTGGAVVMLALALPAFQAPELGNFASGPPTVNVNHPLDTYDQELPDDRNGNTAISGKQTKQFDPPQSVPRPPRRPERVAHS